MVLKLDSINYRPMFDKLNEKSLTSYQLEKQFGIPNKTMYNLRNNKIVTIETLAKIAFILDTDISQLVDYHITIIED